MYSLSVLLTGDQDLAPSWSHSWWRQVSREMHSLRPRSFYSGLRLVSFDPLPVFSEIPGFLKWTSRRSDPCDQKLEALNETGKEMGSIKQPVTTVPCIIYMKNMHVSSSNSDETQF